MLDESREREVQVFVYTSSGSVLQRKNHGLAGVFGGDEGEPTVEEGDGCVHLIPPPR